MVDQGSLPEDGVLSNSQNGVTVERQATEGNQNADYDERIVQVPEGEAAGKSSADASVSNQAAPENGQVSEQKDSKLRKAGSENSPVIVETQVVAERQDFSTDTSRPCNSVLEKFGTWAIFSLLLGLLPFLWTFQLLLPEVPGNSGSQFTNIASPNGEISLLSIALLGDLSANITLIKVQKRSTENIKRLSLVFISGVILYLGMTYGAAAAHSHFGDGDPVEYLPILNSTFWYIVPFCFVCKVFIWCNE